MPGGGSRRGNNMPGGDGTGPMGMGPMTGRGRGLCRGFFRGFGRGLGRRQGLGLRRGWGHGRGRRRHIMSNREDW